MLELQVFAAAQPGDLADRLGAVTGVGQIAVLPNAAGGSELVRAGVAPDAAEEVLALLTDQGVADDDFTLSRIDLVAPQSRSGPAAGLTPGFVWVEVLGEARANARPIGRFLVLMAIAGVIAGLGVIQANGIFIVGAMAVSPDLLPICAGVVGIVGLRPRLAARALLTLLVGMALAATVAGVMAALLDVSDLIPADYSLESGGIGSLSHVDYTTILIAFVAGIAAMLSFETRASAAVGVAISVTTIPAAAYLGVSIGVGDTHWGALVVLLVNVVIIGISGSLTLVVQELLARARRR
jgi:uncharacterized hydrophobic protein (TIGR00271 family)